MKTQKQKKITYRMPFMAKVLFPTQIIIFLLVMTLYYIDGVTPALFGIAALGCVPSALLMITHREYMRKTDVGRRLYHKSIAYLIAMLTAFAYLWLLIRSGEYGPLTRMLAAPSIILIYYSMYINLEGKGRTK